MNRKMSAVMGGTMALCLGIYLYPNSKNDSGSENGITMTQVYANTNPENEEEENENYEGRYSDAWERDLLEAEKTKDPALGVVPIDRLGDAITFAEDQKANYARRRTAMKVTSYISWEERGPIGDIVGPSNGNNRGNSNTVHKTSGRIRAVLFDEANDPSGNTVFVAGVAGGLWKTTNFLTASPNWVALTDHLNNMAISSICQDPSNPQVMYFATGEATSNSDAVFGDGVWKSTDAGATWHHLPSSELLRRNFKVLCDNAGNLYVATRALTAPVEQPYGLFRSKDGGATFQNINPTNLTTNNICTDIEISRTGRFHASFGYLGTVVNHMYTDDPANVTTSGWTRSTGIRLSNVAAVRMELATSGDTVYAITVNTAYQVDSSYRSTNGGATWTRRNTTAYSTGIANGQGWYNLTLSISPTNTEEIMMGGLDAYRSTNGGTTATRVTFWVNGTLGSYVHADHHFMRWWRAGTESRMAIGCDGGIFYSNDNGTTWTDRNQNLGLKQFFAGAIHPAAGSPYLLAGAQDNGTHAISTAGLSNSVEVTGGDGAYVHIDQQNPNNQMGAYVYNQYRRSLNGGATWTQANFSSSQGLFINPFTLDDATNTLWACWGTTSVANNTVIRWPNANTGTSASTIVFPQLVRNSTNSNAVSFKVSPYTANRLYIGGSTGKLLKLDNSNATTAASIAVTDIGSNNFPAGFMNCVNVGSSDQHLVAVFTNYGVKNIWVTHNGGEDWEAVDGNLPDMPVRWAMFHPQFDNRLIIATEAGVYTTDALNGDKTKWNISSNFPTVRTDMLQMRTSDYTIVAATHGRGLYTGQLKVSTNPEVNFVKDAIHVSEQSAATEGCRGYKDYSIDMSILNAPAQNVIATLSVAAGNTAIRGVDFEFTSNGDFTNPSNLVTFAAGTKENKTVFLRIYDDAEVESVESAKLTFTVSGDADAEAGTVDMHEIIISDNDHAPVAVPTALPFSIGDYTTWIGNSSPFAANRVKQRQQSLFTAAELKAAGFYKAGSIKSLSINVAEKNSTQPYMGLTISMANVANVNLNSGYAAGSYTQVYSANYSTVLGTNTFVFDAPFEWDGVSNIAIQICFDNAGAGSPAQYPDYLEGNAYPLGATVRASTYANFVAQALSGCELPAASVTDYRYNVVFGADLGINPIATTLNSAKTEYLNSTNDLYYYAPNGEIIARVRNLSADNFGCTEVKIDRAGTSALAFWNTNKKNYLTSKSFLVSGANAGAGKYEVTFYYTAAEKAGWEAATGEPWSQIQLVRTSGKIGDVTPANAKPNNNGTVQQVVNAVHGTYGSGYTLTAVFEGGFGGFAAGLPGKQFNVTVVKAAKEVSAQEQQVTVANNPFRDQVKLIFAQPLTGNSTAVMFDMQGKPLQKNNIAKGATSATIHVANASTMSRGIYLITLTDNGKQYQVRLMKQ